jgi:hypothetical protein
MKTIIRTMNFFAGINSRAIALATKLKNESDTDVITASVGLEVREFIEDALRKEKTDALFYAAGKLLNASSIKMVSNTDGRANTLQDAILLEFACLMTNDVMTFVYQSDDDAMVESPIEEHAFTLVDKRAAKSVAADVDAISDELRDELSGANVEAGAGDNDCGDACKI